MTVTKFGANMYWNEKTARLVPYIPGEQPRDRKFIKLNTNENPYPPSPHVIEAIKKAAGETLRLYPDPECTELREAIAGRYGLEPGQVFAGNGSDEILAFIFAAFFGRDKGPLLFPDISYSFYPVYADLWDVPSVKVPLKPDFSMDISAHLKMLAQGECGGIIFANPNAPTGMAIPLSAVRELAGAAVRERRVLVIDEAYIAFADGEGISSALPLIGEFPNLLLVRTLSKEASLAGLRGGFAMGNGELIEGLRRVRDSFNSYTLDRLALSGAVAAIKDAPYYEGINRKIIATRSRVSSELKALGFRVLPSQANFVFAAPPETAPPETAPPETAPPNAAPPNADQKSAKEFFSALRERGFLVRHFNKQRIESFLRITIGTDGDMDAFLDECSRIVGN